MSSNIYLAFISQHFWSHILHWVNRFPNVSPQLDREAPKDWPEGKPSLQEQPVEKFVPKWKNSKRLTSKNESNNFVKSIIFIPDIFSENWQNWHICFKSCPGKYKPLPPQNLVLVIPKLRFIDTTWCQTLKIAIIISHNPLNPVTKILPSASCSAQVSTVPGVQQNASKIIFIPGTLNKNLSTTEWIIVSFNRSTLECFIN